jgi:hypothetical protein
VIVGTVYNIKINRKEIGYEGGAENVWILLEQVEGACKNGGTEAAYKPRDF